MPLGQFAERRQLLWLDVHRQASVLHSLIMHSAYHLSSPCIAYFFDTMHTGIGEADTLKSLW